MALSRERLISQVWGMDFYGDDRTLDTHIKLLRKRLGRLSGRIVTLRGVGYRFEDKRRPLSIKWKFFLSLLLFAGVLLLLLWLLQVVFLESFYKFYKTRRSAARPKWWRKTSTTARSAACWSRSAGSRASARPLWTPRI